MALLDALASSVIADRNDFSQGRGESALQRLSQTQAQLHDLEGFMRRQSKDISLWSESRRLKVETAFKRLAGEAEKTCRHLQALHTASQTISKHLLEAAERQLSDGTYRRNGEKQESKQLSLSQFSAKL